MMIVCFDWVLYYCRENRVLVISNTLWGLKLGGEELNKMIEVGGMK
jgi:hypothetical protein